MQPPGYGNSVLFSPRNASPSTAIFKRNLKRQKNKNRIQLLATQHQNPQKCNVNLLSQISPPQFPPLLTCLSFFFVLPLPPLNVRIFCGWCISYEGFSFPSCNIYQREGNSVHIRDRNYRNIYSTFLPPKTGSGCWFIL